MPLSQGSASVTEGSGSGGGGGGGITRTTLYDPATPLLLPQGSDAVTLFNALPTGVGASIVANRPAAITLANNFVTNRRIVVLCREGTTVPVYYTVNAELQATRSDDYNSSNVIVVLGPTQAMNANSGDPKWSFYLEIDTDVPGALVVGCIDEPDVSLVRIIQEG